MADQTKPASATEKLRSDIIAGVLVPGERLPEIALTERYSVGRAAIRSALVELRAEGLVDIAANRGAVVRRISLDEAIEIAEARKVLETLIAAKAALNHDPSDESLSRIVDEMRTAVSHNDNSRYSELNRALHRRIWEIGRHRVGYDLVSNLRDRSAHHQYRLAVMPGRAEESLEQHTAIVEAIASGDPHTAARAMERHLDSVIEVLDQWSELGAP
ncbi:MAG TPA: GntR family transcriptional regulator [Acidimicrobiia bacterium]|nr:GntR family transcriptional regulator [Acidimicrobiia bacterium]